MIQRTLCVVSPVAGFPAESFLVFCASATELASGNSGFGGVIFVFSAGETALGALTGVGEPLELPSGFTRWSRTRIIIVITAASAGARSAIFVRKYDLAGLAAVCASCAGNDLRMKRIVLAS